MSVVGVKKRISAIGPAHIRSVHLINYTKTKNHSVLVPIVAKKQSFYLQLKESLNAILLKFFICGAAFNCSARGCERNWHPAMDWKLLLYYCYNLSQPPGRPGSEFMFMLFVTSRPAVDGDKPRVFN